MSSQPSTNGPDPGKRVDPAAIDRELSALWLAEAEARQESDHQAGQTGKTLARTLLLNLMIFAPDQAAADRAREAVAALVGLQPSRAIVMVADENAKAASLDAWISLDCASPLGGADEVCGEHITLAARGPAILDLPGTVLPLLLTDVPTFLWWQAGNPFTHPIFDSLVRAVDRVILDSLTFTAPPTDLSEVARAVADGHFPAILTDLSWARLAPWRYLTAQIFDPQAVRAYLNELERVRITYYEGPSVLAWLFGGWLASRLEWEPARQEVGLVRFEGGQTIEFQAAPAGGEPPGYFAEVQLMARDGATFEIARLPNACAVTRLQIGAMKTEHVVPVRYETLPDWLGHELNRLTRSATFEAAVRLIAKPRRVGALPQQPI